MTDASHNKRTSMGCRKSKLTRKHLPTVLGYVEPNASEKQVTKILNVVWIAECLNVYDVSLIHLILQYYESEQIVTKSQVQQATE